MLLPATVLLLGSPLLVLFGGAITAFAGTAALQLIEPAAYIESVFPAADEAIPPTASAEGDI
jgi:hypothetical protein